MEMSTKGSFRLIKLKFLNQSTCYLLITGLCYVVSALLIRVANAMIIQYWAKYCLFVLMILCMQLKMLYSMLQEILIFW